MKIIKIGSIELTEKEAFEYYHDKKYLVTYSKIYQLETYPVKDGCGLSVCGRVIYSQKGLAKRGRFHALTANEVNSLIGYKLLAF